VGDVRRLIAFDLDGTLIDSRRDLANSANALIEEFGGSPLPEEAIGRMVGEGARVLVERAIAATGLRVDVDTALARFLAIYDTRLLDHTVPYDGMLDALHHAREHARLAVLTNKPRRPSETILEALGLRDLFDEIVGGDGPLGRKPDPAGLHGLMRSAGATADTTLMVGDSAIDHETALRASTRCCLTAYGYGYLMFPPERLTGREWVVNSTGELREVISRWASGQAGKWKSGKVKK
jgi:phosphoglycolate phosphatase